MSKFLKLILISTILIVFCGCTSWHSLKFQTESQPIQFGPHLQTDKLDTLGVISGISTHDFEEDTYSESPNVSIVFEGKDEVRANINTTIYKALYDDPNHFIADGQIVVEVEHGMSLGSVFMAMIASIITDEDPDVGTYHIESIYYNGIVYKMKAKKLKDEK
jgi:hypothetical protein